MLDDRRDAHVRASGADPIRPKALIIDDEAVLRRALSMLLQRIEWTVDEAPDGAAALAMLSTSANHMYDVILVDVRMPVVNGLEFCSRVIADLPSAQNALVLCSASLDDSDVSEFVSKNGIRTLRKPFSVPALMAALVAARSRADAAGGGNK
jgi:CheY-like chemotaxis protein